MILVSIIELTQAIFYSFAILLKKKKLRYALEAILENLHQSHQEISSTVGRLPLSRKCKLSFSWNLHVFWLVPSHDLLEDRHIHSVTIITFCFLIMWSKEIPCWRCRSETTSNWGKNYISDMLCRASCAVVLFSPHFDVICDV